MPIFEITCSGCGYNGELLVMGSQDQLTCPQCGGTQVEKLMSKPSALTGSQKQGYPGPGDHSCCGSTPGQAGCAGPGSCCGRN
ncbi:MAG: zinc ribbon domain-containing protein [Proteobacteria bacterium]|nr:zinc ribbon domain-containing protein [Pseudomonadota bacterium]MBU1451239.1 zinc ribbon domain-containing protein [Pseudomonadota bacterium]MBU2468118.1 zinc ribbon domain-containing protein [Pseudomonadota bacterium]MBU2516362.1 zinc ribbon domain-containing protein [Pseudomonadota bacterium]